VSLPAVPAIVVAPTVAAMSSAMHTRIGMTLVRLVIDIS
jgi:hypothetical protein